MQTGTPFDAPPLPAIQPMMLGDIFDRTIKLVGRLFVPIILILLPTMLAPAALLVLGIRFLVVTASELQIMQAAGEALPASASVAILGGVAFVILAAVMFFTGWLSARLSITILSCGQMENYTISWKDSLRRTFGKRLFRALGQVILSTLVLLFLLAIPFILFFVGKSFESNTLAILGSFSFFIAIPFMIYYVLVWSFALPAISWEEAGVLESFNRSEELVGGTWWRVFGILYLLSVLSQFAVSFITMPVFFFSMWDIMFSQNAGAVPGQPSPELLPGFVTGLGISLSLTFALLLFIEPLYTTVLYYDLRARKGEFQPVPPPLPAVGEA